MSDDHLKGQIVKHYAGSHAYGTSTPESDVDFRGIFLAEKKFIITPFFNVREVNDPNEEDTKFFELNHFMELCVDANPNILETLWVDEQDIVMKNEMYDHLRSYRSELLSTKIAYTYTGYAHNQATRMKNHHGWMAKEQVAERRLREIYEKYKNRQVVDWMYQYFPHYVVDRIDTTEASKLQFDIDFDKFLRDSSLQLISTTSLAQHHFVRLVHNYLPQKVLDRDFNLLNYNHGYELIHYGDNIFAIIQNENSKTIGGCGEIVWDSKKERTPEELKVIPSLIVKFNKKEFEELNENRKHYHEWKKNRNSKRSELESLHGYDCYQDDTQFLTKDGWKFYDQITETDLLATFDKNHEIEYQNYTERFENMFTGNMYHFTGQHQDTLVTSNHKMYVKDYARNYKKDMSEWKFVEACQLKETYKILNVINPKRRDFKDSVESPIENVDLHTYLRLMGWYISEGSVNFDDNGIPKSVYISQCKPNNSFYQSIHKLLKNDKIHYTKKIIPKKEYQNYDENRYSFGKKYAIALVNDCSAGSHNVKIPNWVFDLSKRKMDILLKSLLEGDGSKRKLVNNIDTYVYHTVSSDLADDVQKLAFLCGYETSKWGPYTSNNSFKEEHVMYQVHINKSPETERINTKSNMEISSVNNNRTVCFSVPNSTLVTRRNGKISLHSNCKHAMHVVRLLRTAEEALETGVVNVRRPDAKELLEIRNGAWSYDQMLAYFEEKDKYIKEVAVKNSSLRKRADIKVAAKVMEELYEMYWYKR